MARALAVGLAGTDYTAFVVVLSPPATAGAEVAAVVHHSPDFASVNWGGTIYTFTRIQRKVIAELWRAREAGYHFVSQSRLLAHVESDCKRLRDLFRRHPAYGVLIVPGDLHGGRAGTYRLAPDPEPAKG